MSSDKGKWRSAMLAMVCLASLPVSGNGVRVRGGPSASDEVRAVLDRQVEAWNRRDLEGFMDGYWRSPELTFFSNSIVTSGWDATLQRYRQRYQSDGREMGKLQFLDLKIEELGPRAAFVRGRFHLNMTSGESSGLFTLTFKKLEAGWKIVHDHTSSS